MKVSKLKYNPDNPRKISATDMEKLKKSIENFPEMMELRPMVYDPETMQVLGGNQRLAAIKAMHMKDIPDSWAVPANKLTPQQKKEFVLKDNIALGEWDFEMLAEEFDAFNLEDIGIELPPMDAPDEEEDEQYGGGSYEEGTREAYSPILAPSVAVGEVTDKDVAKTDVGVNVEDRRKYVVHMCPNCGYEYTTEEV